MDNKITKKRLTNLLSYEWVIMLIVMFFCVISWELIYAVTAVKLTPGQKFYYYYDYGVSSSNDDAFKGYLANTFSYDVIEYYGAGMIEEAKDHDMIQVRYSADMVDVVFSNSKVVKHANGYEGARVNLLIDTYVMYDYHRLYVDAENYLKQFLLDGQTDVLNADNFDENKISSYFLQRLGKDNRYKAGLISAQDEIGRIKKLSGDLKEFKVILDYEKAQAPENSIFYYYHKYEQTLNTTDESSKGKYQRLYDEEGGEKAFGLKLENLPIDENKKAPKDFFRLKDALDSKNVVLTVFDCNHSQPDLQFESIAFINTVVKNFSSILN